MALILIASLLLAGPGAFNPAPAQNAEEDWPDYVDYYQPPGNLPQPPNPADKKPDGKTTSESVPAQEQKEKKGFRLFKKRSAADKTPPPTEDQIVKVGPYEPPAIPDPLLRLSVPIQSETGTVIPSGFYLVRQLAKESDTRRLALTRQNKIVWEFAVHRASAPDENVTATGTPSPVTKIPAKIPPAASVTARLSDDRKTVVILVKDGSDHFESNAWPTATDLRKPLTF